MGLMIGIALVVFAFVLGEPDARQPLMGIAAFPALIGLAYLACGDSTSVRTRRFSERN